MPLGGKLVLKGGTSLGELKGGVKKKKKKKTTQGAEEEEAQEDKQQQAQDNGQPDAGTSTKADANAINVQTGKNYEQEFEFEMARRKEGKARSTPWGSGYRAAPEILHGYSHKVSGKTASERLDMRSATKSDKFAK